jgi:hypothetical protein
LLSIHPTADNNLHYHLRNLLTRNPAVEIKEVVSACEDFSEVEQWAEINIE